MKKVLMIARAFPPFLPVGHSIRVVKFIQYLPETGWLPVVLTVDDRQEYETMPKIGSEALLPEIQTKVTIHRTIAGEPSVQFLEHEKRLGQRNWLTKVIVKLWGGSRRWMYRTLCIPDRHITWLPFALRVGYQIVKEEKIDVIFATCPPHSSTVIGAVLKLFTRKPLILDYRDDWIDTPWFLSKPGIVRWLERKLERWTVKVANKVILVTEWSQRSFQNRYSHESREKFVFIPNGCDLSEFIPLASIQAKLINSDFTVFHAGSLNVSKTWGRNLEGLLVAIRNVLEREPALACKFRLVFAGDLPEEYSRLATDMGLSHVVHWLGHIPHNEVLRLIKSADMLLAVNYDGWETIIPGKIYEYWAAGGPPVLLLSCPGAASDLVYRHKLGFTVEPLDVVGIQKAILDVYRQSDSTIPLRISNIGIEAYDRKVLTRKLSQVLSEFV